jgi:putative oxidoreductase
MKTSVILNTQGKTDLAMLLFRVTVGSILIAHGAQKLFGWFGGYGLGATRASGWPRSISRPVT